MDREVAAEFHTFKASFRLGASQKKRLARLISPTKYHFGMSIDRFYKEVSALTGITITSPSYFHSNLQSTGRGAPGTVNAIVFFIVTKFPYIYSNFQPKSGYCEEELGQYAGKPFWEIIPELPRLVDEVSNTETTAEKSSDGFWGLFTIQSESIDENTYALGFTDHRQRPSVGNPVEVFVEAAVGNACGEADYEYGFRSVRIRTDIRSDLDCDIRFNIRKDVCTGANGRADIHGVGIECYVDITANKGTLNGNYAMSDLPLFSIVPHDTPYEFTASLFVQAKSMNISRTDGLEMPSTNKTAIIKSLLFQALNRGDVQNNWVVLSRQKLRIIQAPGADLYQ